MKKALILAAGIGKRLGDLTKDTPKSLLPVDLDNVLLDYSLEALKENNINEIIFISGFAHEKLKEHVDKKWSNKLSFRFIFNDKFKEYNNIYSAYLAKDIWDDETVLLNSDIIFHAEILSNLKSAISFRDTLADCFVRAKALPHNDVSLQSFLVIDDKKRLDKEDMKVTVNEKGEIKRINKSLDVKQSFGEYIGITYLRGKERVKFLESLEENVKQRNFDLYYEDTLDQILNEVSVFPLSSRGLPWTEVDTKEDYELAKKIATKIKKITIS